ncbi:MAG: LON peptidase substrate-binding domain-containing protein, partial [Gammaproteobacteria bacterium]
MSEQDAVAPSDAANDASGGTNFPARLQDSLPSKLLLLPLQARPFFPAQTMPIVIDDELWRETIERASNTPHHLLGLVYTPYPDQTGPSKEIFHEIGTVVRVHQPMRGDGRIQFIAEGLQRFRISSWISHERPFVAQVDYPQPPVEEQQKVRAYALAIIAKIKELLPLNPLYKENLRAYLDRFNPDDASPLADFAAALTNAGARELQEVLAAIALVPRMEKVMLLLQHEIEVAGLQSEIRQKVEEQ